MKIYDILVEFKKGIKAVKHNKKVKDPAKQFEKAKEKLAPVKPMEGSERTMSRAAKGHEKYGKAGMQALAKAGRDGAGEEKLDKIRDRYDKYDNKVDEESKGLYYNVNKRKKAGISRPASHPKAPTAQAWKDAAKTAKKESMEERVRDPEDWDEGNTEPGNNFAVYINGKKWKVLPGPYGAYADSPEEEREFYRLKAMAHRKSEATGKKWEVYKTGERATESIKETATPGATSAGNVATLGMNPKLSPGPARGKKSYTGSPGKSGTKAPPQPKVIQPKGKGGTAKNALDMKSNIFGGGAVKRK